MEIKKNGKRNKGEGADAGVKWEYVTAPSFLLETIKEVRVKCMGKQWGCRYTKGKLRYEV